MNIHKIGKRLRQLREERWFSQEQVAQMLGISRVSVINGENGSREPKMNELLKYSEIFDMSLDAILLSSDSEDLVDMTHYNERKFKNLLLYILNKCWSKPNVWKTVLYKLLYFSDFNFFEKTGKYLTGVPYIKLPMWPAPYDFDILVKDMIDKKELFVITAPFHDKYQQRYIPNKLPEENLFTREELAIMDDTIESLSDLNASEISEYSHGDVPWRETQDMGIIDYKLSFRRELPYSVLDQEKKYDEVSSMFQANDAFNFLLDEPDLYDDYRK